MLNFLPAVRVPVESSVDVRGGDFAPPPGRVTVTAVGAGSSVPTTPSAGYASAVVVPGDRGISIGEPVAVGAPDPSRKSSFLATLMKDAADGGDADWPDVRVCAGSRP